jgi:hypothetical protein
MPWVRTPVKTVITYKVGGVTKYREIILYMMVWHPDKDIKTKTDTKTKSSDGGSSGGSSGGNTVTPINTSTTETHIPPFVPPVPTPIVVGPPPPGFTTPPPAGGTGGSGGVPGAGGSTGPGDIPGTTPGYGGTSPGPSPPSGGGGSGGGGGYVPPVITPISGGSGGGGSQPIQPTQPRPPMSMVYTPPPPPRSPQEIANLVSQGIPPYNTLRENALTTMREQGYTPQGAMIDGQLVPYGSFKVTFQGGYEFTPQSEDELINSYASEMERQYREQGTKYVEQGYTPVIDENGNVSYTRPQQNIQLLSGDYIPREGDVQQYPGGPITQAPDFWSDARKTIHDFFAGISNALPDFFGLRPDESGITPFDRKYMPNLEIFNMNDPAFQRKYNEAMSMGGVPFDQYTGVKPSDIAMGLLSIPQMAYFGWGVKSLTTAVEAFPLVSKFVYGGTRVAGTLFGVGAVKQIIEEENMDRKIFDIAMLTGQIFGASVGTGGRLQDLSWTNIRGKFPSPSGKKLSYFQDTGQARLQNMYNILGREVVSPFYQRGYLGLGFDRPYGFEPRLVADIPTRPSPFSWEVGPRKGNLEILEYGGRGELKLNAPGGSIPRDVFEGMTMEEYGKPVDRYEFPSGMKTKVTKLSGGLEIVESGPSKGLDILEPKPSSKILELGTIDTPLYWGYGGGGFIPGSNAPSLMNTVPSKFDLLPGGNGPQWSTELFPIKSGGKPVTFTNRFESRVGDYKLTVKPKESWANMIQEYYGSPAKPVSGNEKQGPLFDYGDTRALVDEINNAKKDVTDIGRDGFALKAPPEMLGVGEIKGFEKTPLKFEKIITPDVSIKSSAPDISGREDMSTIIEKENDLIFKQSGLFESPDLNVYFGDTVTLKILNDMEQGIGASDYWKDVKPKSSTVTGSRNGPVLLTDVFSVNIQGELPVQAMGSINLSDVVQGRLNISQNIQRIINEQNNDVISNSTNINAQIQSQIQSQVQQQLQKMDLRQTTELVDIMEGLSSAGQEIGFGYGETVTGERKGLRFPRPIPSFEEEIIKQGIMRDSWDVLVRGRQYSHGKKIGDDSFHKAVPHALSFDDAMSMGVNIVGNSSKATFKLEPSTKKPHKLSGNIPSWESEIYKYKQKADNIWVELPSFRIDSPGELKQITMKGGRR